MEGKFAFVAVCDKYIWGDIGRLYWAIISATPTAAVVSGGCIGRLYWAIISAIPIAAVVLGGWSGRLYRAILGGCIGRLYWAVGLGGFFQ